MTSSGPSADSHVFLVVHDATGNTARRALTGEWWLRSPLKRMADVGVAAIALVVLSPLMVMIAVLVRLRLGSPVLFHETRAGWNARPIRLVKFRSMSDARDRHGDLLADHDRLDRFGQVLRASSLDELPQLVSVIRGDLSLVGPRPLPMKYVARYDSEQRRRLGARPGLTGWAQVHGRNTLDWPARFAHDLWYVDHASARIDIRILVKTARTLLSRDGVNFPGHVTMAPFTGTPVEESSPAS